MQSCESTAQSQLNGWSISLHLMSAHCPISQCCCIERSLLCWYCAVPGCSLQTTLMLTSSRKLGCAAPKMHRTTKGTTPAPPTPSHQGQSHVVHIQQRPCSSGCSCPPDLSEHAVKHRQMLNTICRPATWRCWLSLQRCPYSCPYSGNQALANGLYQVSEMRPTVRTGLAPHHHNPSAAWQSHLTSDAFSSSRMAIPARLTNRRHPSSSRVRGWRSTIDLQGHRKRRSSSKCGRGSGGRDSGERVLGKRCQLPALLLHWCRSTGLQGFEEQARLQNLQSSKKGHLPVLP